MKHKTKVLEAMKEANKKLNKMQNVCKQCNGKGTIVIKEIAVIGSDGEYEVDFDVTVECPCISYE